MNDQQVIDEGAFGAYARGDDGLRHLVPPHWRNTACGMLAENMPPAEVEPMCEQCIIRTGLDAADFQVVGLIEPPET